MCVCTTSLLNTNCSLLVKTKRNSWSLFYKRITILCLTDIESVAWITGASSASIFTQHYARNSELFELHRPGPGDLPIMWHTHACFSEAPQGAALWYSALIADDKCLSLHRQEGAVTHRSAFTHSSNRLFTGAERKITKSSIHICTENCVEGVNSSFSCREYQLTNSPKDRRSEYFPKMLRLISNSKFWSEMVNRKSFVTHQNDAFGLADAETQYFYYQGRITVAANHVAWTLGPI